MVKLSAFTQKTHCRYLETTNICLICRPVFENEDGSLKKEGDIIKDPLLAKTFQKIAKEGAGSFYSGSLSKDVIHDLSTGFGENIITEDDLFNYRCGGVKMSL